MRDDNEPKQSRSLLPPALALALLGFLWGVLPAVHDLRHLCPLRPDGVDEARAVPSFARQTGMSCAMCHTNFPELTPFGRRFKLNGYTLTTKPADISDYRSVSDPREATRTLVLSYVSPISIMLQTSYAKWNRAPKDPNAGNAGPPAVPASAQAQGDTFLFPDQFSFYYAGRVTDNLGTWIQLTYDGTKGSVGIDNTELRYSDHTDDRRWVWGTFVNNTPGMEDVYNTQASAFSLPLFNVPSLYNQAPGGGLRTPIIGKLAANSVGAGEYAFFDDALYMEAGLYHSGTQGSVTTSNKALSASSSNGAIDGLARRLRLAYEYDWERWAGEVGVMGMQMRYLPGGVTNVTALSPATPDEYLDGVADAQVQYLSDDYIATLLGSYTHERQSNNPVFVGASFSNPIDSLNVTSLTGEYYLRRRYGGLVSWVNTTGVKDPLMNGADGSPDNQYWVFELDYMPWLNTKFILQYDVYMKVAGNQSPFFGNNTRPTDNNTLVAGLWTAF